MRYYYMDSLRSVLMTLGIVLHAASIYAVSADWIISDARRSRGFDALAWAIHTFRMPAFFIIAGYFAHMTWRKYGTGRFLGQRIQRLLVPLLSAAILLNTAQAYACRWLAQGRPVRLATFLTSDLPRYWSNGEWVQHLWFLNVLIVFCLVCPFICPMVECVDAWLEDKHPAGFDKLLKQGTYLWLLPLTAVIAGIEEHYVPILHSRVVFGVLDLSELLEYFPYFAFGLWMHASARLAEHFSRCRFAQANVLLLGAWLTLLAERLPESPAQSILEIYGRGLLTWSACQVCFALFHRYLNRPSKLFAYMSDASYTIYLFHHLCVTVLGALLVTCAWPAMVKFLVVVLTTLLATLAVHHWLVLRVRWARLLFNGK